MQQLNVSLESTPSLSLSLEIENIYGGQQVCGALDGWVRRLLTYLRVNI